ncbi:MAG: Sigma-70, region 4 type 2, partial [Verrucomicrobiales bacterium]|nr:Sigma-70, region 4 type 2 [Verrucomicrobiales bacterium]
FDVLRGPVKAWIAIGSSHAVGLIFASGGIAIAPISFGGIAIGLVPIGAVAIGLFSLGACSLGIFAFGGLAVGWQIYCGFGLAWNAAMGGVTLARDFAIGGFAHAPQANTELANQFFLQQRFFKVAAVISSHPLMIMLLSVIPAVLQARIVKKARKSTANHSSR